MRWTLGLAAAALAGALTPATSQAVGTTCVTGQGPYTGCTWVVVVPGVYCWVVSAGTVAGTPYSVTVC